MAKMIQLRNVPDSLHRQLKARAALEGLSLSDYLTREVRKIVERPTPAEFMARVLAREPAPIRMTPAEVIREMRDGR